MMLVLCAALALTVCVTTATAEGGNSGNAKLCQNGGWQHWLRSDGTSFKNQGDCVSYATQGGTLTSPSTSCKKTSYGDFLTQGPINTSPNGHFYDTRDGSCSSLRVEGTLVQASSSSAADAICAPLIAARGATYYGVLPAGGDFTSDYWFCDYEL
jgi:hypothetical protein